MNIKLLSIEPIVRLGIEAAITTKAWPEFVAEDLYDREEPFGIGTVSIPFGHHIAGRDHPDNALVSLQVVLKGIRTYRTITNPQDMVHVEPTSIFDWVREHCSDWDWFIHQEVGEKQVQFSTPTPKKDDGGVYPQISYLRQGQHAAEERTFVMSMHVYASLLLRDADRRTAHLVRVAEIPAR
jgi:hypothetical protein